MEVIQEFPISLPKNKRIIVDGALLDAFTGEHGYWEAKDLKADLEKEARTKLAPPHRDDDKEYILRLIGQVITVSLKTVKIVNALPDLGLPKEPTAQATTAKATTTVQ